MARIIAIANQKGGVGKTTTTINLGAALARMGKRVLLIDTDSQDGNLTSASGMDEDAVEVTIAHYLAAVLSGDPVDDWKEDIITHKEKFDLIPCNKTLSQFELSGLFDDRNDLLKEFVKKIEDNYDYILIDCPPTLGQITINGFVASDYVLIPTEAAYLAAKGTQSLLDIIAKIKHTANRKLQIMGILLTKVDSRCSFPMQMIDLFHQTYGKNIKVFDFFVPFSVKFPESNAMGVSNLKHNPSGKGTAMYDRLAKEVVAHER